MSQTALTDEVIVPREPTEAMIDAARDWSAKVYGKPIGNDAARGCYSSMLSTAPPAPQRETPDEGHPHLIAGEFQSDKYPTCPRGKVPLSVKDKTAQDLLWEYAQRRRVVDAEFAADLEIALTNNGYIVPAPQREDGAVFKTHSGGAQVAEIFNDNEQTVVEVQRYESGKFDLIIHNTNARGEREDMTATLEQKHFAMLGSIALSTNPPRSDSARDAALEECAKIAEDCCLVPPDGGSPSESEREMCAHVASIIRLHKSQSRPASANRKNAGNGVL